MTKKSLPDSFQTGKTYQIVSVREDALLWKDAKRAWLVEYNDYFEDHAATVQAESLARQRITAEFNVPGPGETLFSIGHYEGVTCPRAKGVIVWLQDAPPESAIRRRQGRRRDLGDL